ncbi:MAG: hypothetical protein KKE86_11065 [Planctomycetes bacterium]|nr:hypothetical protein [Planctomycetota bacterium]MBU4399860.1 hypothetical protein [Planctomycetota bacterium]MCG2684504.1 hypothetical protein [Planctomycetales bacterium]
MEQTTDGQIRAVERTRLEHDDKDATRAWLAPMSDDTAGPEGRHETKESPDREDNVALGPAP